MKVRQDAWSHEDDVLLAETVLRHIREGSTQLWAFDEVGDILNRTSAACGFRWNAVVRERYVEEIKQAKKERKERKKAQALLRSNMKTANAPINLTTVIEYLKTLNVDGQSTLQLQKENERLQQENMQLKEKNKELENELNKLKEEHSIIEEDYQSLIQIMNRARRMAILQDDEPLSPTTFRMDKNGNLEKIAK